MLGKGWTAELSGFTIPRACGAAPSKQCYGEPGCRPAKKLWHDNATIKASVSDIFFTMKWQNESTLSGSNIHANGTWESRQFKLTLAYNFGNNRLKMPATAIPGLMI